VKLERDLKNGFNNKRRMSVKKAGIMIMLLFVELLCTGVRADTATLNVVFEEWPPYVYTSNGKIAGTDVEILEEAGRRLGINFRFSSMPWVTALKEVKDGTADAILSLGKTEERTKFLYYPDSPINMMRIVFFVLRENPLKVSGLNDLKGLNVGIVEGNFYGRDFEKAKGFERTVCRDHKEQFKMLLSKRLDLLISTDLVGTSVAKRMGILDKVRMLKYVVAEEPLYVGFSKAKGEQAKILSVKFSGVFKQMQEEGFIKAVLEKDGK
jgi:polar amino acid transport system substrate-binding protein